MLNLILCLSPEVYVAHTRFFDQFIAFQDSLDNVRWRYDRRRFADHGLKHVDLYFLDGSCPDREAGGRITGKSRKHHGSWKALKIYSKLDEKEALVKLLALKPLQLSDLSAVFCSALLRSFPSSFSSSRTNPVPWPFTARPKRVLLFVFTRSPTGWVCLGCLFFGR